MSLLSRFFPSGAGGASGNFGTALSTDLKSFPVDILVIGGGGGGGTVPSTKNGSAGLTDPNAAVGGGGGGGRVIQMLSAIINTGTPYPITIGAGGAAGCQGGTTCFGTSLIAGGGGGGGTPATFGRAQFEPGDITETAGAFGGDNNFSLTCLSCVPATNPSYPYMVNNTYCKNTGRRTICCSNYEDTTFPITYYDVAGECSLGYHLVSCTSSPSITVTQNPYSFCRLIGQCGSDTLFDTSRSSWFCNWFCCSSTSPACVGPAAPLGCRFGTWQNAIFKKINHPLSKDFKYGTGGLGGNINHSINSFYSPVVPGCVVTNFGSSALSGNVSFFSSNRDVCGGSNTSLGLDVNNFCQAYSEALCSGTNPLISSSAAVNSLAPKFLGYSTPCSTPYSPQFCYTGAGDRSARGAGWVFSPISDTCIRTAMLSTYTLSLFDDGPGLYDASVCASYAAVLPSPGLTGVPGYGLVTFYPSTAISNLSLCDSAPNTAAALSYINAFNCCRGVISPNTFTSYASTLPSITPLGSAIPASYGRVFTPATGLGFKSCQFSPLTTCDTALFPLVTAATTPCVHVSDWCAAQNGQAGSGGGGGGGVNMGGTNGCCLVFRYQFGPTCTINAPVVASPLVASPCFVAYGTNLPLNPSLPAVCYMRCILPSPPAMSVGGSGGSGGVYIVYPTDYPAATASGNTAVPSPPAYRVYYWQGTGSITFNQ